MRHFNREALEQFVIPAFHKTRHNSTRKRNHRHRRQDSNLSLVGQRIRSQSYYELGYDCELVPESRTAYLLGCDCGKRNHDTCSTQST